LVTDKAYRHDTLLKIWYDGKEVWNFDPDEPPFRAGAPSAAECRAMGVLHPSWETCHTGIDIFRDSRDKPPGGAWCVAPCVAGDEGAQLTQMLLWTFNYRRGYPPQSFCDNVIGKADTNYYARCSAYATSADEARDFDAFLHHSEVRVNMDDWVVANVPLPLHTQ
jgi:hypothetical protein